MSNVAFVGSIDNKILSIYVSMKLHISSILTGCYQSWNSCGREGAATALPALNGHAFGLTTVVLVIYCVKWH